MSCECWRYASDEVAMNEVDGKRVLADELKRYSDPFGKVAVCTFSLARECHADHCGGKEEG